MSESFLTILYGILEGVTEFLPISSTGHLLIVQHFFAAKADAFNIIIQAGAVSAVVAIYWRRLLGLCIGLARPENRDYLLKLGTSFAVTIAGCYIARSKLGIKLPEVLEPVVGALLIGALLIFLAERLLRHHRPTDSLSWSTAIWVGVAQILAAVFPGTSRSGATIIAAMFCGMSRPAATEFSFLLSIPTMFAASAYAAIEAHQSGQFDERLTADLVVGFVISMLSAFIVVKWLLKFVRAHTFTPFAWYRIALGIVLVLLLAGEHTPADLIHE
ncbi:MAG: undecaprenyl-diphosphate phosphatase [Verrucomicrobiae bacterium]|nr:undecaprenyl-diphosphate phosphatase [Verrucomicrobiae bacterium]